MSTALIQDPSESTLAVKTETTLSNGDNLYTPNVVQPMPKASHSRQGSAAKRKRAQSGMDVAENTVEAAQNNDFNGYDKPKRQRLESRGSSEQRTLLTKPLGQTEYPLHQVVEEGSQSQFTESYMSPCQTPPNPEPLIQSIDAKEQEYEIGGHPAKNAIPQDVRPTADSSEQSQNAFPTTPNFKRVFFGSKIVEPWYFSPYPLGEIALQAWNPNMQFDPYHGQYHPGGKHAKGQFKHGKYGSMMPQAGIVNGYASNGAGPSRSNARHDVPLHANGNFIHVCDWCFVYNDRFIRIGGRHNPHDFECPRNLPGRIVYDDQGSSEKQGVNGSVTQDSTRYDMNGVPPTPDKENRVRIYEVDPATSPADKIFCKNITLFGKFFIDSKSIVYDCVTFLYYIITIVEEGIERVAGFFTKEKESVEEYNLACIIVFPPYQRKGLGTLLIQFSYELSKHDGKIGSPEKPLSTFGTRSYSPIWVTMVLDYLYEQIAIPYEMLLDRPKGNTKRPLGTSRVLKSKQITESGTAMEVNLMFSCTLEQIAAGAYLTASDASFALAELGLQKYITGFKQSDIAGENNANAEPRGELDAGLTGPSTSDSITEAILPVNQYQTPTDILVNSSRDLSVAVADPVVPILTREFIRLLGEKLRVKKRPINKEFVLL